MEWLLLLIAGVLEVTWAIAMKASEGFTKMLPTVITVIGYISSAIFLALALKKLPLGTAYAMWTGFGILGASILGIMLFKESISMAQAGCIALIVLGITGLRVLT